VLLETVFMLLNFFRGFRFLCFKVYAREHSASINATCVKYVASWPFCFNKLINCCRSILLK